METNGNTNGALPPVVSEMAQENFYNFLSVLERSFPTGGFITDGVVLTPRNKCAETIIMLQKQWMLEDMVEMSSYLYFHILLNMILFGKHYLEY